MKEALIILGDQLFPIKTYKSHKASHVFMAEDMGLCTHFRYHKHKIIFFLSSMRTYADELLANGFQVHYEPISPKTFLERLDKFLKKNNISIVRMSEVQDKFFEKELMDFFKKNKLNFEILPSPMFLSSREDFKKYLYFHPKPFMKTFYEGERKRLKILLTQDKKPIGGQWSYDTENRKKAPKVLTNKPLVQHAKNKHVLEVIKLVDKLFSSHPGRSENFWLPVDRKGALKNLKHFIEHHLNDFGDYQDAITNRSPFLYHSIISPMMNAGLLTPQEVIDEVIKAMDQEDVPLASVEGFVRQVMGWREFVRGIYQNFSDLEDTTNFFKHQRKLTSHWYDGTTGIPPVDDAIKKANEFGYCHHIERLMILSNIMLLSEIHPREVYRWFMEMFVDSADWVMGPNVYGMGQFSDGGIFATKPYISGSNYILKMSDYKKEDWCDIWDGLFWRFIGTHKDFFSKNPRLSMMARTYDKMDPTRKKMLLKKADDFIHSRTT